MSGSLDPRAIATALNGEVSGDQISAPGPGHSADDRSLSVKLDPKAPEGFLVNSFAGDDPLACRDHVRSAAGLPERRPAAAAPKPQVRRRRVAEYRYYKADTSSYGRVIRYEPKGFSQEHWDGTAWVSGKPDGPKIPYRLREMVESSHDRVCIVEGEKAADALADRGFIATTNSEGAGKWTADLNQWFKAKTVLIFPDNDEPGEKHAQQVAQHLHGVAASVRIVRLSGLPPKGDVVDWLEAGGDATTLLEFCREQPLWSPGGAVPLSLPLGERDSGTVETEELRVDTLAGLERAYLPKRVLLLAPVMHRRSLLMLYAARGVGKTLVGHGIGYAVASGGSFLRWKAERPAKVLLIDGEMPAELLQQRIRTMRPAADRHPPSEDYFRVISMDRQELGVTLNLANPDHQALVESKLDGAELLILDNISTLVSGGRENDADSWDSMQPWLLHLRRLGVSVLLIAHAGRGENARGTSKREDVLDTVIQLRRPGDYDPEEGARFEVILTKARGVFGDDAATFEAQLETREGADFWSATTVTDLAFERVMELSRAGKSVRDIADELDISKSRVSRMQTKARAEGKR